MQVSSSISGIKAVDKVFANMPRSSQRKIYMKALRSGANVVKEAATENIRQVFNRFTGVLSKKSTLAVYNAKKYRGNFRVLVQIRRGLVNAKVNVRDSKTGMTGPVRVGLYAAVGEYGSQKLNRRPRSWIRKAIREKESPAVYNIRTEFSHRLIDAVEDAKR